jgi:hypothetical protein
MPDRAPRSGVTRSGIQRNTREALHSRLRQKEQGRRVPRRSLTLDTGSRDGAARHAVRYDDGWRTALQRPAGVLTVNVHGKPMICFKFEEISGS